MPAVNSQPFVPYTSSPHATAVRPGAVAAPLVTVVSPAALATISTLNTPIVFNVTSQVEIKLEKLSVRLYYGEGDGAYQVAFTNGALLAPYQTDSSVTAIAGGWQFSIRRNSGWLTNPSFSVIASDSVGNVSTPAATAYTFNPGYDVTGPTVAIVSPASPSTLASSSTAVVVDITDVAGLDDVLITATYDDAAEEVVYSNGAFSDAYSTSGTGSVSNGTRFTMRRDDGWRTDPNFHFRATDDEGNATSTDVGVYTFAAAPITDVTAPVVAVVSPTEGALITPGTPLVLDITDNLGLVGTVVLIAVFAGQATQEVIYDGATFTTDYGSSLRGAITNGYRFTITRAGGWPASPTIKYVVNDTSGNLS